MKLLRVVYCLEGILRTPYKVHIVLLKNSIWMLVSKVFQVNVFFDNII